MFYQNEKFGFLKMRSSLFLKMRSSLFLKMRIFGFLQLGSPAFLKFRHAGVFKLQISYVLTSRALRASQIEASCPPWLPGVGQIAIVLPNGASPVVWQPCRRARTKPCGMVLVPRESPKMSQATLTDGPATGNLSSCSWWHGKR